LSVVVATGIRQLAPPEDWLAATSEKVMSCLRVPGTEADVRFSAIMSCQRSVAFIAAADW